VLFTSNSVAKTLPLPSLVFNKSCQIIHTNESANCDLIYSFSSHGNISTILATVLAAQEVCNVAITKFQVSAALKANLKVSKSLISQIIITSLACLNAYFKPFSKLFVFNHTSLCSIKDLLLLKTYSIGSSTVIICFDILAEIVSINADIVVDLPDQTDQVTNNNQFFLLIKSSNFSGNHKSLKLGNLVLIGLNTAHAQFLAKKTFTLNLEYHFKSIEKSSSKFSLKEFFCFSVIIDII